MKKLLPGLFTLLIVLSGFYISSAQNAKKELRIKIPKDVKQEAKSLEKEGFYVPPGALSIERQITNAWLKEQETDDYGYPKFVFGEARVVGETQIAAKTQAMQAAKLEIAGKLASEVAQIVESNISNAQLNTQDAASVTETTSAAKSIIAQKLGRVINVIEMYRDKGKNVEVNLRIAYNNELAMDMAKETIRAELKDKSQKLGSEVDQLLQKK